METVLDWAVAQGYRIDNSFDSPRCCPGCREPSNTIGHCITAKFRRRLQKVRQSTAEPVTKLSFECLVLTAARSGEVRLATWDQIDWDERKWTVPAEHMKARREHKVPLSKRALEVLRLAE